MVGPALRRSALFAASVLLVYAAAVLTPRGQELDALALGIGAGLDPAVQSAAGAIRSAAPWVCAALAAACAIVCIVRRMPWVALLCLSLPVATFAFNTLLREFVLARPFYAEFGYRENTFPSGHVAAVVVVCAGAAISFDAVRRPSARAAVAVLLVAVPVMVATASVIVLAHRGSDVVGGALLAGVVVPWFGVARGAPAPRRRAIDDVAVGGAVLVAVAVAVAALALLPPSRLVTVACLVIVTTAATAAALWPIAGVSSGVRRSRPTSRTI